MAFEEYIRRAILTGRTYDDLPARVKAMLPLAEWRSKVRDFCVQRGYPWATSAARHVCSQQEYYEDLLGRYKAWGRIFPYHLSEYVCRVQRASPFKYYTDVLYLALREERSYDTIPNFTAADALCVTGVGRNEFIAIMNACKAKKLMWRVNKALARDLLPQEEKEARIEPWWLVEVTNVGETEFRELAQGEANLLRAACDIRNAPPLASKFDTAQLRRLHRQGLLYFDVPIMPTDRFSIPPLEGFVSNRTTDASASGADPVEALLYKAFVASSERLALADLAGILAVPVEELQVAMSVACRLGFATRLAPAGGDAAAAALAAAAAGAAGGAGGAPARLPISTPNSSAFSIAEELEEDIPAPGAATGAGVQVGGAGGGGAGGGALVADGAAIAVVVDSEATSYLMMGALSPGLKRHSVTLFEAGRVSGAEVMTEMIRELWVSYEAGQGFEGDMQQLTNYTAALATLLDAARSAGGGAPLELVRKESLAGLDPTAASKVMAHSYCAVLPIAPLPGPPLPVTPFRPGPTHYGPTAESGSPWLQLALYSASRSGPVSLVLAAGQRLWKLPPQLEHCSHALLWCWDPEPRAGLDNQPLLAEGAFLLAALNDMLARCAVLAQPLLTSRPVLSTDSLAARPAARASDAGGGGNGGGGTAQEVAVEFADVPLPLRSLGGAAAEAEQQQQQQGQQQQGQQQEPAGGSRRGALRVRAVARRTGRHSEIELPGCVVGALRELGLEQAVGYLRVLRITPAAGAGAGTAALSGGDAAAAAAAAAGAEGPAGGVGGPPWVPLAVQLGVPLYDLQLCKDVCAAAVAADFLSPSSREAHTHAAQVLQAQLWGLVSQFGVLGGSWGAAAAGGGGGWRDELVACGMGELTRYAELPAVNLLFDGTNLQPLDLGEVQQVTACLAD